jgi:hypothetical protein
VLLAAVELSRGEPEARTQTTTVDSLNKIRVKSFYFCESFLHLSPLTHGESLQFDDGLVSLVRWLEALCTTPSTSREDSVLSVSYLASHNDGLVHELLHKDLQYSIADLRLLVDPEDQLVVSVANAESRRLFNLHGEALYRARYGTPHLLGSKWCSS